MTKDLTTTEKYVLEIIEQDPLFFAQSTLDNMSKKWFVGKATIMRVVAKQGYSSLHSMQNKVLVDYELNKMKCVNSKKSLTESELIDNVYRKCLFSILETQKNVLNQEIISLANDLKTYDQIIFLELEILIILQKCYQYLWIK